MHSPVNIHRRMRNARIARQALLQAYRANPMSAGANIVRGAMMRISRVAKPGTLRHMNINIALLPESNVKKLQKHGLSEKHAKKLHSAVLNKHAQNILNFPLNNN